MRRIIPGPAETDLPSVGNDATVLKGTTWVHDRDLDAVCGVRGDPQSTRWMGRKSVFLGDRRRLSLLHCGPSDQHLRRQVQGPRSALGIVVATLVASWTFAGTAVAAGGPPAEVIIAVDTSESMEFAIGSDLPPDCSNPNPVRTRWNAILEMLVGTHSSYGCKVESMVTHPDAVAPPKQAFGAKTCIGGVPHALADDKPVAADSNETDPIADRSWAGAGPSASSLLRIETSMTDMRLPYLVVDTKNVPVDEAWVTGRVVLTTKDGLGAGVLDRWVYLVDVSYAPSEQSSKEWVCGANSAARTIVSEPVKLAKGAGQKTTIAMTSTFLAAAREANKAGKGRLILAVVPADNWIKADCSGRDGKIGTNFDLTFYGPSASTSDAPHVVIGVGKVCDAEGPGAHYAGQSALGSDGLIDTYGSIAKFSLMVPDSRMGASDDDLGGFSFGAPTSSLWGTINVGAESPLSLTSKSTLMTRDDLLVSRLTAHSVIKDRLKNLRPNGGTPLGRFLQDIAAYYGPSTYQDAHFKTTKQDPVNGDPYFECRQRYVLLLSDGGANLDDGVSDSRQLAVNAAAALMAQGITVIVVAVGHDGSTSTKPPPTADLAFLDELALAGGSSSAWRVQTPAEINKLLKATLGAAEIEGFVGTRTVWTEATGDQVDVQHTIFAKSFFNLSEPVASYGLIEQRLLSCTKTCVDATNPGTASVCAVINYADQINATPSSRKYLTTDAGTQVAFKDTTVGSDAMTIPNFGQAPRLRPDPSGACVTEPNSFDLSDAAQREQFRQETIALVRSESGTCREAIPLGAVGKSQPAVLDPADGMPLNDPVFTLYQQTKTPVANSGFIEGANPTGSYQRPTMVFAATHDGLLHAFRTDRDKAITFTPKRDAGDEMWSWIPGYSLRRLRELKLVTSSETSLLGGDIVATHALLERKVASAAVAALEWRAVVLVGAGEAGAGYTALDVTAPNDPQMLWEITPDRHCWGPGTSLNGVSGPKCALSNTFVGMGRSTAKPILARAYYKHNGATVERTVAIIAAGMPPNDSSVSNVGVDGNGERAIYIVELATGRLVRKLSDADIDATGITTTLPSKADLGYYWTEPACYNTVAGSYVSRCFLGDSKGMLWRVDLSHVDPLEWKIDYFHDAYSGADCPAALVSGVNSPTRVAYLSAPSVATDRSGQLVVVAGTGDADSPSTLTRRHVAYSLTESVALNGGGVSAKVVAKVNWVSAFDELTQFIGAPLVFSGNAYWATYTASQTGVCTTGIARLWGVDYNKSAAVSDLTDLQGAFPNPAAPAKPNLNLDSQVIGSFVPSPVEITPVPSCRDGCGPTDTNCLLAKGGGMKASAPKYQVNVGSASQAQSSGQKPAGGTQPAVGSAARGLAPPTGTSVITGWDLLFD